MPSFKQAPPPFPKQPTKEEVRKHKFVSFKKPRKPLETPTSPPFSPKQPIMQEVCKQKKISFKNPNQPLETLIQPPVPSSRSSMLEILSFVSLHSSQGPILEEAHPLTPIEKPLPELQQYFQCPFDHFAPSFPTSLFKGGPVVWDPNWSKEQKE